MKENRREKDPRQRIKEVSAGYAFNYLIPKQIAEIATRGKIKHINMLYEIASKKQDIAYNENAKIKYKLEKINSVRIRKKCSTSQLIFGSISTHDIVAQIFQLTGEKIDRKHIILADSNKLGKHTAKIKIGGSISSSVNLHIIPKTI